MKVSCPHCSQRILLDSDSLASLHGSSGFDCPHCGGWIPFPPMGTPATPPSGEHRSRGWAAPEADELAKSFDSRYQIRRLLGRGGMGAVYEGFDTRLDRRVAIKILPQETGSDSHALARFEREAKSMAALDHPNIVHIHDFGQTPDGNPYFVMEFIDGMDVHQLRLSGQLDLPGALDLISQVCAALHYAHSRGIVHRDIKPANILVSSEGVAKVADFGLAKVLGTDTHAPHEPTLTRSGTAMGTPDYMAPEQMEGQAVDHRADIYSLGIMLYDLLTGSPPRGAWPPPSQRVQIDVRLDEIVLRSLQHNPSARYQAASEVHADIDSVKSSTGGGPLPPGTHPEPLPSQRSGSSASLHSLASAPGGNRSSRAKIEVTAAPTESKEIAASARSLGTTLLILGLLAITITGGLAFYLANRKPVEIQRNEQTITTHETHNTHTTRIVIPGIAASDLDAIEDIKPFQDGFLGVTKDTFTWSDAQELAARCGAEILSADDAAPFWQSLRDALKSSFPARAGTTLWVRNQGAARILKGDKLSTPESPFDPPSEIHHKALLHWLPAKAAPPVPQTESAPFVHGSGDWINLFDGLDVSKWKGSKDVGFPEGAWGIEGGALRNFHGRNDQSLVTRETFRNFELVFEWKFGPGSNSGIFYGMREFQLVDDVGHPNGKVPVTSCGALCYFIPPNTKKRIEPAGEYNRGKLVVRGNQVEHWINGEKVVDYELGSPALESLVVSGQFKNLPGYKKIDTVAGETPISLQSHSGNVWFRNIRIRKLDGPRPDKGESGNISPRDSIPERSSFLAPEESFPTGQLPWTNTDGKTIQAEFVRISDDAVFIRKDGKEFSIPLAKLSPASRKQASVCAPAKASTDKTQNKAATQNTPNLDYGLLIHYGMQTFTGPATGGEQSEKAAASRFAPANVDVKSWAKLAKEGGMTFAVMNVKHSSGFRLWDAPFDDYDLGGSPFKRDLLAEFIESCNAEGLMPGANYIVTDVHREGAYRRKEPVPASHMKLVKQELGDLLTRYPGLRVLAFGHLGRFTPQEAAEIRTLVQTLNPKCVILDDETSGRIYQCKSTVRGWFLASPEAENPKAVDLFGDIQKSRDEGKPFLLNVGPAQDGQIPSAQRDLVLKMKGFGVKRSAAFPQAP